MEAFLVSTGIVGVAEMGDKTRIATVMLAARHDAYFWRVAGITLGMMPANALVVWPASRFPHLIRCVSCAHRVGPGFCRAGHAGAAGTGTGVCGI